MATTTMATWQMGRGGRAGMGEPITVRTNLGAFAATVDWFHADGSVDYTGRDEEGRATDVYGRAPAGEWGQR